MELCRLVDKQQPHQKQNEKDEEKNKQNETVRLHIEHLVPMCR